MCPTLRSIPFDRPLDLVKYLKICFSKLKISYSFEEFPELKSSSVVHAQFKDYNNHRIQGMQTSSCLLWILTLDDHILDNQR